MKNEDKSLEVDLNDDFFIYNIEKKTDNFERPSLYLEDIIYEESEIKEKKIKEPRRVIIIDI